MAKPITRRAAADLVWVVNRPAAAAAADAVNVLSPPSCAEEDGSEP